VLNTRFSFSVKFFLVSYFLLSILATLSFVEFEIPHYQAIFKTNEVALKKNYPDSLVITWDGKELKNSNPQLVEISYPVELPHDGLPDKLAYIDSSVSSIDQLSKEHSATSLFSVTKDTLYVSSSTGGWSPLALKETPGFESPFTITKDSLPSYISTWESIFTQSLNAFALVYPFAFFFIIGFLRVFSLLLNSVFAYYLLRVLGKNLPYKKVFQIGLHISVVAGLLDVLTAHFLPLQTDISIYTLAYWLYLTIILISLWNVKNIVKA